jgi:response regulator RpfG family c-di-GMP phosphodiesterase/signal transduction histidine kinase
MDEPQVHFEERLSREYDLKGRTRLILFLSGILYPSFLALDAIYAAPFFSLFLIIRLVVLAAHIVLLVLLNRIRTYRGFTNLCIALTVFDVGGIAVMIQVLGGFQSEYVQGLYLIIMGMAIVVPLAFRDTIVLYVLIWVSYAIPGFLNMSIGTSQGRGVITNLFFLTAMDLMGGFGSYVLDNYRRRELRSRIELEATTAQLQESNIKLKSLDELKTQFFANINHELRTPLTLMLAPLGPMIDGNLGRVSGKHRDTLAMIRHNGLKLLKLINNLLDLTKLEEGKMRLKIKSLEFVEYVNALLGSVRPLADRKSIKLYFQHPPHDVPLTIDPENFEKVVLNLLSNALKFTPEGGRITLYIEEHETNVTLIVEDTGIGIPENMRGAIFDRFSQVDGSLSRAHEGTGIGLSLASEIVKLHGGRIRVESELGKGSRFFVEILKGEDHYAEDVLDRRVADLPVTFKKRATDSEPPRIQDIVSDFRKLQLTDLEREEIGPESKIRDRTHAYRLLVIDDNPEILKLMKLLLEDEYDLDFASSGEEGLGLMRTNMPDLVLSDVMMPGMDGRAFCRKVKEDPALKHIPVMLVTARSGAEMLVEGIEAGADDYIAKPFDSIELKARIRSLLRMRKAEADLALINQNLKVRTQDLVERQRTLFLAMVKSLVSALEAKDKYTRDHSTRVTDITISIAKKMGFEERELRDLELASVLHDVGKIALPERILNKKSKLTDEEMSQIRNHPVIGETILMPVVELRQITKLVRHHHERYDGSGYPDKLKGQEIPVGARIMAVADTYDAITSDRPYRNGESQAFAVKEIIRCSGSQFDPEVIEHFLEIAKDIPPVDKPSTAAKPS